MRNKFRIISGAEPSWTEPVSAARVVRNARMRLSLGEWFWREAGGGSSVVACLHGLGQDSGQWQPLLECLGQSCHCIAPDLPGVGGSARSRADSLPALMAGLDEWLDALRVDRLWLLGSDLGAWLSIRYALYRPQRVLGVVLVAPEAALQGRSPRQLWPWMTPQRRSPRPTAYPFLTRAERSERSERSDSLAAIQSDAMQPDSLSGLSCPVWTLRGTTESTEPVANGRSTPSPHAEWLAKTRQAFVPAAGNQWLQESPAAVAKAIERTMVDPRFPVLQLDL